MPNFLIGCQTYSWEMLGSNWCGSPRDILDAVSNAGYAGVEFSNQMIGPYFDHPEEFEKLLDNFGLRCAAFAYARNGFCNPEEMVDDLEGARRALRFAAHFSVVLGLGGPSSLSRENYEQKLVQALIFYQEVARMAEELGVTLAIHPHSHHTSLVITDNEYDWLIPEVASLGIHFNPDTGHILRGRQDLLVCLHRYQDEIVHVHIKDIDESNEWAPLGKGITPVQQVLKWLEETGFSGWVVIEEESRVVREDVRKAVENNRRYLREIGY